MKLKTKFQDEDFGLGELADVDIATMPDGRIKVQARAIRGGLHTIFYKTKAKFDADWEDATEELKEHWYIDLSCNDIKIYEDLCVPEEVVEKLKQIGNYFSSQEEAEKGLEKLKAWQRLKDKGFKFRDWNTTSLYNLGSIEFFLPDVVNDIDDYRKDLDLLFSGGEEWLKN